MLGIPLNTSLYNTPPFASLLNLEKVVSFSRKTDCKLIVQPLNKKAISRIYGRGRGWAFSSNDFVEEFSRSQIDYALSELCREGKIRRVCRGIYDYPKFSELLQQDLSPDFDQVAQAFTRASSTGASSLRATRR